MSIDFEELDYRLTPLGAVSLRRRTELSLGIEIFEVKLDDAFLMSSLFTEGETALARLALAKLGGESLDVLVGGLGLGYTARAVLDHPAVRSMLVVEALAEVIDWHRQGLVPLGASLASDRRCEFLHADFFALIRSRRIDPARADGRFDAILVDIDHSPRAALHPSHGAFYSADGLRCLTAHLRPQGVFALWSNDPPDDAFRNELAAVFAVVDVHVVSFHNPLQNRPASNTVYVAHSQAQT